MNTFNLITAICYIQSNLPKGSLITAIQFEDGSGKKFNFQLDGGNEWKFIDLSFYITS